MSVEVEAVAKMIADVEGDTRWEHYIPHARAAISLTLDYVTASILDVERQEAASLQPAKAGSELQAFCEHLKHRARQAA